MTDYFHVNILNEGMIPWLFERGPLFGYYIPAGVYDLLKRDPRVTIEITTKELELQRRAEYAAKKNPQPKKESPVESVKVEDKVQIEVFNKPVENDEFDDEIDAILNNTPEIESVMKVDMNKIKDPVLDADGFVIYTEEEISKMTKKDLKAILETRGHAAGQRFVKTDDPFSPMYHDSVDDLREKVRKSQETF